MYKAKNTENKTKLLRDICFSSSSKVDLTNIKEYKYSQRIL